MYKAEFYFLVILLRRYLSRMRKYFFANNYKSSPQDYKLSHLNLTPNNGYADQYQKLHRYYVISISSIKINVKGKTMFHQMYKKQQTKKK